MFCWRSLPAPAQQSTSDETSFSLGSVLVPVSGNYPFTEGPATDANGNVYFSDVDAGRIYKWSPDGNVSVFLEGLNMPTHQLLVANKVSAEYGYLNGDVLGSPGHLRVTVTPKQRAGT